AGRPEGYVGGVHRMVGAVRERHRDITHRKATERPALQVVCHTYSDRGNKLARHSPAGDRLGKLEACAAHQRLDVEHHITELTVPTRLLLVSTADLDALADGFLVRHLAGFGHGVHPVF